MFFLEGKFKTAFLRCWCFDKPWFITMRKFWQVELWIKVSTEIKNLDISSFPNYTFYMFKNCVELGLDIIKTKLYYIKIVNTKMYLCVSLNTTKLVSKWKTTFNCILHKFVNSKMIKKILSKFFLIANILFWIYGSPSSAHLITCI